MKINHKIYSNLAFNLAEKKIISRIGRLQRVVSYPYGESSPQIQELVKEMG